MQRSKVTGKISPELNRSSPDSRVSACVCFLCGDLEHDPVLIHALSSSSPLSSLLITGVVFMNSRCKNLRGQGVQPRQAEKQLRQAAWTLQCVCVSTSTFAPSHSDPRNMRGGGNGPDHGNLMGGASLHLCLLSAAAPLGAKLSALAQPRASDGL